MLKYQQMHLVLLHSGHFMAEVLLRNGNRECNFIA
jgi:hypothetical protein